MSNDEDTLFGIKLPPTGNSDKALRPTNETKPDPEPEPEPEPSNIDSTTDGNPQFSSRSSSNRRYQILEAQGFVVGKTLGQGSYATVKSAYDINRKHKVAIKIISKKKAPDDYLAKFLPREIEIVRTLSHPSLVTFYQVIETTSRFFLVMECCERGDLLDAIRDMKLVPEDQAGLWFRSLHDGILYMHSRGIVHRDLKCENLLIDNSNNLKVTDFGFARKNLRGKMGEIIYSETYCGSYAYAPPEILKGIPYNPFLAEIWSMGVVLYTMVYGKLPFDDTDHKKLLKQTQSRIIFPAKPEVSEECRILILKMLIKGQERVPIHNLVYDNWFKKKCQLSNDDDATEKTSISAKALNEPELPQSDKSSEPNSDGMNKPSTLPSLNSK